MPVLCSAAGAITNTPACHEHASTFCGTIATASLPDLLSLVNYLINKRHADRTINNKKGFHRTPDFIQAVVTDARHHLQSGVTVADLLSRKSSYVDSNMTMPPGGYTDVGLHTGGAPRATSWPMVQQTLLVSGFVASSP